MVKRRNNYRSRTDPTFINQLQPQTRITASVIMPTLEIDREPQVRWATAVTPRVAQKTSYRLSETVPNPPSTKQIERSASNSLLDLSSNVTRTQSFSQS
jgi:hypothetical protein